MPEISRFFGIVIKMYYEDHIPAHFHAEYSGQRVLIDINTFSVFAGSFPPRALGLVIEWATLNRTDLLANFIRASKKEELQRIAPLD